LRLADKAVIFRRMYALAHTPPLAFSGLFVPVRPLRSKLLPLLRPAR
jgi:hypothetical protein